MTQSGLWYSAQGSGHFAELCNALYQREIHHIALGHFTHVKAVQARLRSLPYYVNKTAHAMVDVSMQGLSPLQLDHQNATWSAKQSKKPPLANQTTLEQQQNSNLWYLQNTITLGLVVPVLLNDHIIMDCVDRIDLEGKRLHTNVAGWFSLSTPVLTSEPVAMTKRLLKPNKKIMVSACAGHCWQGNAPQLPIIPSLRELLLSCSINWSNFKTPLAI